MLRHDNLALCAEADTRLLFLLTPPPAPPAQADALQTRADALLARADTIDGLIQATQTELATKRKSFEHYKNRAQTEMAISLQVRTRKYVPLASQMGTN